jgi:hypothetical protein
LSACAMLVSRWAEGGAPERDPAPLAGVETPGEIG